MNALKIIIESKVSGVICKLSEYEKERIYLGRERMKTGETISNEDVQKEVDKLLGFSFDWEGGLKDLKETSVELQHKAYQLRL